MKLNFIQTGAIGALAGLVGAAGLVVSSEDYLGIGPVGDKGGDRQICLLTDAPFFSGLEEGCYAREKLASYYELDLVNARGAKVVVNMSSPPEAPEASDDCRTCADYVRMKRLGWFALSSRDQRREEFFSRACGMLDYLVKGSEPEQSFFTNGVLSANDVGSISSRSLLQFVGVEKDDSLEASDLEGIFSSQRINPDQVDDQGNWIISLADQQITLQPLIHQDFNEDGLGDILVFMHDQITDGTGSNGILGYLTKTDEEAEVSLVFSE